MNFYTKLLQKLASRNPETENDFYFFNTYFFEKINEVVEHEKKTSNIYSIVKHVRRIIQPKIEGAHKKLCRWYKKLGLDNLFLKKHLLIPLNKRKEHWSLVIVCNLHNLLRIMNGQIYLE
jgi:Ulp1 family protease